MMETYKVTATRSDGWWAVHADVPGASLWTQARRLDQVEATVREAIALALDVAEDSFAVELEPTLPGELQHDVEAVRLVAAMASIAQDTSSRLNVWLAQVLIEQGYTTRDTGQIMGYSSQRVSQLVAQADEPRSAVEQKIQALLDEWRALLQPTLKALDSLRANVEQEGRSQDALEDRASTAPDKRARPRRRFVSVARADAS
ncbi:MAG: hypothetical protein KGN78_08580 [Actinomycetales bacterium]|nr:hypothetical protein [Actinomycetales bacterium]